MDFFDLLLQTGLITSLIVGYLILVKKAPTKKGFYSEHGWNYPLKYICALFAVKRWKKQRPTPASEELPSSKLTSGWQNLSVQATGTDGTTVVLGIRRWSERKQTAEVTVFVKLPDGETYTLPRHPDTVVGASEVSADSWSAGGLKIQVLQPRWALRVLFNGLLTRASDGKTLHVRFNFIWRSASQPLHHPEGWSEQLAARALASEPWRDGQWIHMIDRWADGSWHQWGALQGRFTTHTPDGSEDTSVWLRARGVKDLSWAPHEYQGLRRHVAVVLVAKDGTMVRLKGVSYKDVLTQVYYGDVRFPNYEVCPITATDLSLPNYGEFVDGIPENSAISVSTSNGRTLRMVFRLENAGGKLLSGSPTQYEVHYKTLTGSIEGYAATGLLELGYVVKEPRVPSVRLTPRRSLKWLSKEDIKGAISYCAFFDTDPAKCPDLVGGKGASLALLAKKQRDLGYKVPPGYCITTLALDKQLKENPQLTKAISEIEASNVDYIEEVFKEKCNKASALIASTALVKDVKAEILSHLKELRSKAIEENLGPELRFAVRSSAVGEDGEALSAAGQNDTILGCVTDDDVVEAVQKCWASMFAFTSAHYRRQNGQPCLCGGGVVVQALVTPTSAGVLFTRHPAAGDPARLLITANYGLGESVVSGAVEPDSITVARSVRGEVSIAGIELGSKTHRVAAQGSGVTTEDVPESERNVACITDEQILQLAKMGVTQEELWGAPRDIEWAVTKDAVYLLQARPITSLERWSDEELLHEMDDPVMSDDALLSFANIGEVLPKPVSPLNIDLVMRPLQETMTEVVEKPPSVYKRYTIMTHYRGCMDLFNTIYRRVPPKIDVGMRMVEMAIHGHTVADEDVHRTATHVHTRGRFDQVVLMYGMIEIMQCFNLGLKSVAYYIPHAETFATAKGAAANIFKILDLNPQIDGLSKSGLAPRHVKGEISLENVTFSYPSRPEMKVLKDFSLTVRAGETVALVGASGCGKSTILQLIQRLYDTQSGAVRLDGNCVKTLNLEWLRSSLGIVGQEPVLFRGSILDNIMIVSPGASREQVERVAKIAFAHEFIIKLPNEYDTLIGERGLSLSGGQKQRIAIARALLRDPAVLLLDEATSALDPRSEVKVQEALDRASENRTTVIVSHRLSTIVNADRIVCMDKGAIVEMGTHDELISLKGHYWKLVMTEKSKTEPDIIGHVGDAEKSEFDLTLSSEEQNTNVVRRSHKKCESEDSKSMDLLNMKVLNDDNETNDQKEEVKSLSTIELLKLNRKEWYLLVIGIGSAVIQGWVHSLTAIVLSYAVESFTKNDRDEIISNCTFYAIMFVAIGVMALLTNVIQTFSLPRSSSRMCTRLRLQLFGSFLKQDMSFYDKKSNSIGSLTTKLSRDMGEVSNVTGLMLGSIADGLSATAFGLLIGLIFSWKVALIGATFVPIVIFCIKLETMARKNSAALERSSMETANAIASEAVGSIRTVQSLAIEKVFLDKVEKCSDESIRASLAGTRWRGLVFGIGQYAPYVCYMLCVMVGIFLIKNDGEYFINVLIAVRSIIGSTAILSHAMVFLPQFNSAKGSCARVLALIRQEPKVRTEDGVVDPADWTATGEFKLSNVEFSYPSRPHEPVLSGFNLKVEAGKTVALVGPSGCGKSTVLQLLQRFYDPDSGVIELDSLNTRSQLSLPRLRRQLGVVQQEPVLFDRTLAENISYGDHARAVSMQDVVEAAKAANIHSFITSLPKGYDTPLGSSGAQLSGGQKQRVCIARALIRSPRLLLLDEATSALDASSEQAVSDALDAAAVGRTCVTIAHRLTTVQNADVICVVDEHKIVEKGSHAELMQLQGRYWKMTGGHKKKSPSQPQSEEFQKE